MHHVLVGKYLINMITLNKKIILIFYSTKIVCVCGLPFALSFLYIQNLGTPTKRSCQANKQFDWVMSTDCQHSDKEAKWHSTIYHLDKQSHNMIMANWSKTLILNYELKINSRNLFLYLITVCHTWRKLNVFHILNIFMPF